MVPSAESAKQIPLYEDVVFGHGLNAHDVQEREASRHLYDRQADVPSNIQVGIPTAECPSYRTSRSPPSPAPHVLSIAVAASLAPQWERDRSARSCVSPSSVTPSSQSDCRAAWSARVLQKWFSGMRALGSTT
eukprot:scaffold66079_cov60-Phaeocystis_antarctica.AAC.12